MIALGAFVIGIGLSMLDNSRKEPDVQPEPSAVTGTMTIDEILDSSLPFENCEITLEEDTMMISVWEDGVAAGALKAISGDQDAAAEWNDLLEMFCDITNEVQTQFEENGFQG
ncbi:MAG: hypothetical protein IKF51_07365, partial [Solobacterium sp.]|nr:hypothetical protein [Solobacterium sp.]